jgi:hypothetical protein
MVARPSHSINAARSVAAATLHARAKSLKDRHKTPRRYFDKPAAREAEDPKKTLANKAWGHKTSRHKNFGALDFGEQGFGEQGFGAQDFGA